MIATASRRHATRLGAVSETDRAALADIGIEEIDPDTLPIRIREQSGCVWLIRNGREVAINPGTAENTARVLLRSGVKGEQWVAALTPALMKSDLFERLSAGRTVTEGDVREWLDAQAEDERPELATP